MLKISYPLSVPSDKKADYRKNYELATKATGRMLLIAGDQKVEHLNDDFFGAGISPEDGDPEHLFKIARYSKGGLLAVPLGLVSRYGHDYREIPYLIKLNGKTNIGLNEEKDSSKCWWDIERIMKFKKQSGLKIVGVGYTLYLGGRFEAKMLARVARAIFEAHQNGLITVLWVYPRGKNINEDDIHTIAGGAGVSVCLDTDFVKLKYPYGSKDKNVALKFQEAVRAAGRTKVICVGGNSRPAPELLKHLDKQLRISGSAGLAIGRNLHERPLAEANRLTAALGAMIFKGTDLKEAEKIYTSKTKTPTNKKTSRFLGIF